MAYARIQNGVVAEMFSPPAGFTIEQCFALAVAEQFLDVTAVNPPPQPGWTATQNDGSWSFAAPATPTLTPAQQATAALAGTLTINSTGSPAIDGAYAIDPATQGKIAAVEVYILKNSTFPGGATTYPWPMAAGAIVTFPSTTVYQNWATAIANYISALDIVIAADGGALPPPTVTIA